MSVSLYDVLDVAPDASPDEIRAAWKSAIADLGPGDRRFRAYNEAAEVLLDPDRRAAYDAELAGSAVAPTADGPRRPAAEEAKDEAPSEPPPPGPPLEPREAEEPTREAGTGWFARAVSSTWLLVVLLALTIAFAGTAAWLLSSSPSDGSVEKSLRAAESTAQTAAPSIFSYDYRRLADNREKAVGFMTSGYREEYEDIFGSVVEQNAPRLKTVVRADFISSGVVRTGGGEDADDRVDVLVVFDQLTTNKQVTEPQRSPAYAVLTMENVDGDWLVDDIAGPQVPR